MDDRNFMGIFFLAACLSLNHVYTLLTEAEKTALGPLVLELLAVVNCYLRAGNQAWVPGKTVSALNY